MILKDSTRRKITFGIGLFILIGLFTANIMGKRQDEAFINDHHTYNQAVQKLEEGEFEEALKTTKVLEVSQSSSEAVNYIIGLSAANSGQYNTALLHMQRLLEINPHRVEDPIFMIQYAEILLTLGNQVAAEKVLNKCLELPKPTNYPQYEEKIIQLQEQLATQS
ncbi:tetratricopeptide repeat protein [Paenisporosarcina quisquiliarum]|uniref:tetratricopeptide repeat protein n=1 Tax=Paenisporosarcina quisquiliarum TaxID=365346 RepID=UPI0037366851